MGTEARKMKGAASAVDTGGEFVQEITQIN
jgi:hypothetical protein